MRRLILVLAVAVTTTTAVAAQPAVAAPTSGRTFHVATSGSTPTPGICDGGTESAPWRVIEHAMRCLHPGDELIIHGGTYDEWVLPVIRPATPDNPITVRAADGERPVVRGYVRLDGPSYWHVSGLNVTGTGQPYSEGEMLVKIRGGHGWSWTNSELSHSLAYAAFRVEPSEEAPDETPMNWRFANNCVHDAGTVHPPYQDHHLYIVTGDDSAGGVIERNVIFGASNGSNIKLGSTDVPAAGVTIRNNTLVDGIPNIIAVHGSRNITIERNLLGNVGGKDWYPAIRGFQTTGSGLVARDNYAYEADRVVFTDEQSTTGFSTARNRLLGNPQFDAIGCDRMRPLNDAAAAYGHRATGTPSFTARLADGAGTDVAVARAAYPTGRVEAAVIVREDAYPDALASAPLAASLDGPILMTGSDRLSAESRSELQRLGRPYVVIVGGTAALSPQVEKDLDAMGLAHIRLGGKDRFQTADVVARYLDQREGRAHRRVIVTEGINANPSRGWPDAVGASALAAQSNRPILLVRHGSIPQPTLDALGRGVDEIILAGGTAAVSAAVEAQLQSYAPVTRLGGSNRFETSRLVADRSVAEGAEPTLVALATGSSFQDALVTAPAVARLGGVMMLSSRDVVVEPLSNWLDTVAGTSLMLAGDDGALSTQLEQALRAW